MFLLSCTESVSFLKLVLFSQCKLEFSISYFWRLKQMSLRNNLGTDATLEAGAIEPVADQVKNSVVSYIYEDWELNVGPEDCCF